MLRVLIAGVTGWTGAPLARAVEAAPDLELAAGVARRGGDHPSVSEALAAVPADVVVDYTSAAAVRGNVDAALAAGAHVVVGSSGLTESDYAEIDAAARAAGRGVVAAGNFSLLAATLLHAATVAAQHVSHWEVIDYGSVGKPDVPSGTSRELAERLGSSEPAAHDADLIGPREARGASVAGTRVHSLRLPGYALSTDVILATPGERLVIRHEAGASAEPYIAGTLLAIRRVPELTGVLRGLDRLLF
ncbi:4-hydroxy-tetrahydrodipicolinate reductase [Candidatus Solirubrobacter pratensis]|uniref:4-hydroxy-tetrahydrodipicolinate reductase n=1 Tax=Candidatus Solirubrobacter pratensis TaxID=1298857 RepID=UPI0003F84D60|nr:dihydrodipicolinate reductase C-terminal domain-containing protein [Candidatus Solirubrobacter pratensis]